MQTVLTDNLCTAEDALPALARLRIRVMTFSAESRTSTTRIDLQGRPIFAQISGVEALDYAYDARGRLQTVTQGTGTDTRSLTYSYGPDGFVQRITDAATQATVYQRDTAGRVTQATLPDSSVVGFGFDANGNLAQITPPGKPAHGFAYTPVDLESQYTPPAIGLPTPQTQYAYNLDKKLTSVIRPDGASITLGYDSAGRSASLTPSAGAGNSVTYGYSATTGQLNAVGNANVTLGYSFDGALLKQETFSGVITGSIARGYDSDFRTTQLTVNGAAIAFAYDRDSLLTSVGAMTLTRASSNGFLTGSTLGSVTTTQSYNAFGELASFTANSGATPLYTFALTHDKLGRIVTKTETTSGVTTNFDYGYDLAGRLASVKQDGVTVRQYGFDANGNRLTLVSGAVTTSATYDNQDRLQAYGANAYTFGANGELKIKTAAGQTTNYVYDVFGNLTSVTLPDNTLIEYLADGRNRRVGKKVNGILTQGFLYQGQLRIAAELDGTGAIVSRFVYGTKINVPEYMTKGADTYRLVTDHLGSVRLVVNTATGAIAQRLDYDEFGNVLLDTNPGFQPFGFAGGLYDSQTKLVRFGARDFEAEMGRWTAKDPIGFDGGDTNLYLYTYANPVSYVDPFGLVGKGPFQPSSQTALEQAIVRGDTEAIKMLAEAGEISQVAAQSAIRGAELLAKTTKDMSRLAEQLGRKSKDIKKAIEECKQQGLPRNGPNRNPDVRVDPKSGEVYPEINGGNGGLGDSIGNIWEFLK